MKLQALTLIAGLALAPAAQALPERLSADRGDAVTRLRANTQGALQITERPAAAYTRLRGNAARPLMLDDGAARPEERARFFLSVYGAALHIANPATDLVVQRISTDPAGNAHVHFDQVHRGVAVFGARIVVHMNRLGITGVNGVFVPNLGRVSTTPARDLGTLRAAALTHASKLHKGRRLHLAQSRLVVYPTGLVEGRLQTPRLAYETTVVSGNDLREQLFVDVRSGALLNRIDQIHRVLNREVYTPDQNGAPFYDEHASTLTIPAGPADPALVNDPGHNSTDTSDAAPGEPNANLWVFAGGTYALYDNMFGRKGYDACDLAGPCEPDEAAAPWSPTRGNVNTDFPGQVQQSVYLINDACPNAYWNGVSTNYCPGFDADDVVSHEWSHGYTQYTHGLIYQYQSGALNESYSDIFGETYDLVNNLEGPLGSLTLEEHKYYEEGGSRWVVGEDLSDEAAAALLRDMWKPDDFCGTALCARNPGKATSENYTCGSGDNGGVHANSSVPNHAFAMLVDGTAGQGPEGTTGVERDSYNGQSFAGIGLIKAARIYFHAMNNYQTPSTDFPQHAVALRDSCNDLLGIELNDPAGALSGQMITEGDCAVLNQAMLAVEMDLGSPCPYLPVLQQGAPEACEGAADVFAENWESGGLGWTRTSTGEFAEWEDDSRSLRDWILDDTLPGARAGTAALARNIPIGEPGGGDCSPGTGDYSGQYTYDSPEFLIPPGAATLNLRFDHYVATEATFDGGQIEISVNGGAFALVPPANYIFNAPNSALDAPPPVGLNTNPNAGEPAWNGSDVNAPSGSGPGSWGTTVVNVSGLAGPGDTVKLRLNYSQDGCNGVEGWYVDNVRVYSCPTLEAPVLSVGSDYEDPDTDGSFTLSWTRPAGATGPDLLQKSASSCAPILTDDAASLANWTVARTDPSFAPNWGTSQTKPQHEGNSAFWANPVSEQETQNSSATLTYNNPIVLPEGRNVLSFNEWYFNEDDDEARVEVSTDDGATWTTVYSNARPMGGLPDEGSAAFAEEDLTPTSVDLSPFSGQTVRLRLNFLLGESNFFFFVQYGWYVDDIAITNDAWGDVLTTTDTAATLADQLDGTACYRVRTAYPVDGNLTSSKFSNVETVTVTASRVNLPPLANAGADLVIAEGLRVILDGQGSTDGNGDALTYAWTQTAGPGVQLSGASTATPFFNAPSVDSDQQLTFELTVTDPQGLSDTATVNVLVLNEVAAPPATTEGNTQIGGALPAATLAILGLLALARRRGATAR